MSNHERKENPKKGREKRGRGSGLVFMYTSTTSRRVRKALGEARRRVPETHGELHPSSNRLFDKGEMGRCLFLVFGSPGSLSTVRLAGQFCYVSESPYTE